MEVTHKNGTPVTLVEKPAKVPTCLPGRERHRWENNGCKFCGLNRLGNGSSMPMGISIGGEESR